MYPGCACGPRVTPRSAGCAPATASCPVAAHSVICSVICTSKMHDHERRQAKVCSQCTVSLNPIRRLWRKLCRQFPPAVLQLHRALSCCAPSCSLRSSSGPLACAAQRQRNEPQQILLLLLELARQHDVTGPGRARRKNEASSRHWLPPFPPLCCRHVGVTLKRPLWRWLGLLRVR